MSRPFVDFNHGPDTGLVSVQFPDQSTPATPAYIFMESLFYHAKRTPNALCLRLPKLKNHQEYVDVSYARAAIILEHLIDSLPAYFKANGVTLTKVSVVAVLTLPYAHGWFVNLALMRLNCSVQWFNHELGRNTMDILIGSGVGGSDSVALLYADLSALELETLGINDLQDRVGVKPVKMGSDLFSASLVDGVATKEARAPLSESQFYAEYDVDIPAFVVHTSGSTSTPKLVYMSAWEISRVAFPLPHTRGFSFGQELPPFLMVSRSYWGTNIAIITSLLIAGSSIALCYPKDRMYPTTEEALLAVEATRSPTTLLYAGQIRDIAHLVAKDTRYQDIMNSIKILCLSGAGVDHITSDLICSLKVKTVFLNLHGMSEVGGSTGLISVSPPYDGFQATKAYTLFETMEEVEDAKEQVEEGHTLVRMWISIDLHPIAGKMGTNGHSPIHIERYPGPGPQHDRPAINTGDVFEQRKLDNGETRYFYYSRDDDLIRLANLYRPNVASLQTYFVSRLTLPGRLPPQSIDAVQIFGNAKMKLSLVIQLHFDASVVEQDLEKDVLSSVKELDDTLPASVRFNDLKRVKIILMESERHKSDSQALEKTHKNTLRRQWNTRTFADWVDSLDYD